jgi:hypothetical protein
VLRRRFIFEARCHDVLTLKNSACPLVWNGIFAVGDWRAKGMVLNDHNSADQAGGEAARDSEQSTKAHYRIVT